MKTYDAAVQTFPPFEVKIDDTVYRLVFPITPEVMGKLDDLEKSLSDDEIANRDIKKALSIAIQKLNLMMGIPSEVMEKFDHRVITEINLDMTKAIFGNLEKKTLEPVQ